MTGLELPSRGEVCDETHSALSVRLTPDDVREVDGYAQIAVRGARLSPTHMAFIDVDR